MPADSKSPAVILVRPQLGENVGAAARAMMNFGVRSLRIVAPRDGWPNPDAVAMASGAGRILDNAAVYPDLAPALAGFQYVLATTARRRDLSKPVFAPAEAMADLRRRIDCGQKVAVLFGPERSGLQNPDLVVANGIIEVPANPEFRSLNLAQCVLLVCYEWLRACENREVQPRSEIAPAEVLEKSRLVDLLVEDLEQAKYFWPPAKAAGMRLNLRNLIMRLDLTGPEIRTLHGVRRSLKRYVPKGAAAEPDKMDSEVGNGPPKDI